MDKVKQSTAEVRQLQQLNCRGNPQHKRLMPFAEGTLQGSKKLPAFQAEVSPLNKICFPREVGLFFQQSSSFGMGFASILYYVPGI